MGEKVGKFEEGSQYSVGMSLVEEVLKQLSQGLPASDELTKRLSDPEIRQLRGLEESISANRTWRVISNKLLEVALMLNQGRASQEILDVIVRHARAIIGSDISYISLNDEASGFTKVIAHIGVVTREFQEIRMPMGTGVLGLVAATSRPAWTFDHASDPEVTHVDYVDHAVQLEGIHGILGAPIHLGAKTIGALLVGDRQPRRYSREEITALELLGSMAAVALDTARTIEQQDASVRQLADSREELFAKNEQLISLSFFDAKLLEMLGRKTRLEDLVHSLKEFLDSPVALWIDEEERVVSFDPELGIDSGVLAEVKQTKTPQVTASFSMVPVTFDERFLGAVCVFRAVGNTELQMLLHAASACAAIFLFEESLARATTRKVDDLVYALFTGESGAKEVQRLRKLTGIDVQKPEGLDVVALQIRDAELRVAQLRDLILGRVAITKHEKHICAIVQPETDVNDALEPVFRRVQQSGGVMYVASTKFREVGSFHLAHERSLQYLDSAIALGVHGKLVDHATFGSVGLILGANDLALGQLIDQTVRPLVDYDETHNTELERTAYAYFQSGLSIARTARAMYIHQNTVRQRLGRIEFLLGQGWDRGALALDLQMALRIRALRLEN